MCDKCQDNIKVSILVAIYNIEKYVGKCNVSVLHGVSPCGKA